MESKELSIVIVTFKSELKIFDCLEAIPRYIKVIVVENSNNEFFKKEIESKYNNVNCILTGENKGYAAANNIGLTNVETKFALVLNPDAILQKNAVENFFKITIKNDDFWLIGPGNDQNVNLDLPVIGFDTVKKCIKFGFSSLVISSNGTLIFELKKIMNLIKKSDFCIYVV